VFEDITLLRRKHFITRDYNAFTSVRPLRLSRDYRQDAYNLDHGLYHASVQITAWTSHAVCSLCVRAYVLYCVIWQASLKRGIRAFSVSVWRDVVYGRTHFFVPTCGIRKQFYDLQMKNHVRKSVLQIFNFPVIYGLSTF
jgi:hypothetical protein